MPPKRQNSKAPAQGSGSVSRSIDGIPFSAFPAKVCRESYTNSYRDRTLVLERKLHLDSFKDTTIPHLFEELGWLSLAIFSGSACAQIVRLFYSNIIEHDMDVSFIKSSLFGTEVEITPEIVAEVLGIPLVDAPSVSELEVTGELLDRVSMDLWGQVGGRIGNVVHTGNFARPAWVLATFLSYSVYPSSHRADLSRRGCILLSKILHREPINLAACIIDEMIVRGDPSASKKEVLPYGILITKICQRAGVVFPATASFLQPMGPINTSSWNRRKGQTDGALCPRKRVCRTKDSNTVEGADSSSILGSNGVEQLLAKFDALESKISEQSTSYSEQLSQLQNHMDKGFAIINGQVACCLDQLKALEDFVHQHLP